MLRIPFVKLLALVVVLAMGAVACGTDDGASVTRLNDSDPSASGGDNASASASAPAPGGVVEVTTGEAGYEYVSDVDGHRLVVADICEINDLLPTDAEIDFAAVETIYRDGVNSVNSDGSIRSIGGFAARDDRNPAHQEFFGSLTPLDDFVTEALEGTGAFDGESDLVRRQGVQKGIQNQVMVAWVIHELNTALDKAADGDIDPGSGAPHNWDEGWAFYHGSEPGCSPFATANSRAANFDTQGSDGATAAANELFLEAMISGRDALVAGDLATAEASTADVLKALAITYSQATLRYAQVVEDDLDEGDGDAARIHQAEGWAFSRVMAPYFAGRGADMAVIDAYYSLDNEPAAGGFAIIEAALQPMWDALGITAADIGALT